MFTTRQVARKKLFSPDRNCTRYYGFIKYDNKFTRLGGLDPQPRR